MPFAFYGGGEVAAALTAGCAKLTFTVLYRCPLLIFLGYSLYLYSSTGTVTSEEKAMNCRPWGRRNSSWDSKEEEVVAAGVPHHLLSTNLRGRMRRRRIGPSGRRSGT